MILYNAHSKELRIYAVTHEMMAGFHDNHRLDRAEAEELFKVTVKNFRQWENLTARPKCVMLEEIVTTLGDPVTGMRLINHGPLFAFRQRRVLKYAFIRSSPAKNHRKKT